MLRRRGARDRTPRANRLFQFHGGKRFGVTYEFERAKALRHCIDQNVALAAVRNRGAVSISGLMEIIFIGFVLGISMIASSLLTSISSECVPGECEVQPNPILRMAFEGNGEQLWIQRGLSEIVVLDRSTSEMELFYRSDDHVITDFAIDRDAKTLFLSIDDNQFIVLRDKELLVYERCKDNQRILSAISSDGSTAVCIVDGLIVQAWNLANDEPSKVQYEIPFRANRICLDPVGKILFVSSKESGLISCDAVSGRQLQSIDNRGTTARCLAVSDDANWLISVQADSAALYEVNSSKVRWNLCAADGDELLTAKISPDGQWVAISGLTTGLRILDLESGSLFHRIPECASTFRFAFTPFSDKLFLGDAAGALSSWPLPSQRGTLPSEMKDITADLPFRRHCEPAAESRTKAQCDPFTKCTCS